MMQVPQVNFPAIWAAIFAKLSAGFNFFERRWYIIPMICTVGLIVAVSYLVNSSLVAANQLSENVKAIPIIVQTEMEKTRDVLRAEGEMNRINTETMNSETRDQLIKQLQDSESQRRAVQQELNLLKQKIAEIKPAPRKRVLGIF